MKKIPDEVIYFFEQQPYTIVSTIDKDGRPHNSCKGIVNIDQNGKIYLFDLYKATTYANLQRNHHISITAVDGDDFRGYSLKGKAKIVKRAKINSRILSDWEKKINSRISKRLLQNILGEKGSLRHPEALLPEPEYMILVEVEQIEDLTPHHIKKGENKNGSNN